jgi:hypothetical protein
MEWSDAIFSSQEALPTLSSSIDAILNATNEAASVVDVMVHGNQGLANDVGCYIETLHPVGRARTVVRVWYDLVGDKAHAGSRYVHDILPPSEITFFVDGYAQAMPDALKLISDGLNETPKALAASGVPTVKKSHPLLEKSVGCGRFFSNTHPRLEPLRRTESGLQRPGWRRDV